MSSQHPAHHSHHAAHHAKSGGDDPEPVLKPPSKEEPRNANDAALDLIRQKLRAIYGEEPDAKQEMAEAVQPGVHHSRHQQYMRQLQDSGMSDAQIQEAWHAYYQSLDDAAKREVWQEFYSQSAEARQRQARIEPHYQPVFDDVPTPQQPAQPAAPEAVPAAVQTAAAPTSGLTDPQPSAQAYNPLYGSNPEQRLQPAPSADTSTIMTPAGTPLTAASQATLPTSTTGSKQAQRPPAEIRQQLRQRVGKRGKLQARHHLQSLAFGLGFGALVVLVVLFSFFNQVIIAPFIQPSRTVSATPIIVSPEGITASDKNEVIIPKINVEIPLDFSTQTTDEKAFESALDKGVAHYPTTALPGQKGNTSFFGHSSNNIFNPGKYKFAFLMLNELVPGDTFYITYNKTVYAYQVYDKKIVEATEVDILNPVKDKLATAMLVTCDPPGTSLHRLAVWGEQVSPNPSGNGEAKATASQGTDQSSLPGNGPTLWERFQDWITGQ